MEIVGLESSYDKVKLEWHMSPFCNRNCSYCTDHTHTFTPSHLSLEKFKVGFHNLIEKIDINKLSIGFTGGEPTLNPNFLDILSYARKANYVSFTTNGSRKAEYYKKCIELASGIIFSYNMEYDNLTPFQFSLLQRYARQLKRRMIVRIMFLPSTLKETKELMDQFKKHQVDYEVRRIRPVYYSDHKKNKYWDDGRLKKGVIVKPFDLKAHSTILFQKNGEPDFITNPGDYYSQEEEDFLRVMEMDELNERDITLYYKYGSKKTNLNEITRKQLNRFKGWTCWTGIQALKVTEDGTITPGRCNNLVYGNIYEDFELPTEPVICENEWCCSITNVNATKVKDIKYLERLKGNE